MASGLDPVLTSAQSAVSCEGCDGGFNVTWFCRNCPAYLCCTCKEKHSKDRLMKKHFIVPKTGSVLWTHGSWIVTEPCKTHENTETTTFCNDCNEPCCTQCIEEHPGHSFVNLENKYFDTETRLSILINCLLNESMPAIQKDVSLLKQKIDSCNEDFEKAKSEVERFFSNMKATLEQSRTDHINELTKKHEECCSKLNKHLMDSENEMGSLESHISDVERKIRAGSLDLIKYYPTNPQIASHSDVTTPTPHFVSDANAITQIGKYAGRIVYDKGTLESPIKTEEKVNAHNFQIEKVGSFRTDAKIRSIIPDGCCKAWLSSHWSETIYLYDSGVKVKSVMVQESKGIQDIALKKSGDLIVSCLDNKVRRVTVDGDISILIETAPFSCHGVYLTDKEDIVISLTKGKNDMENHVAVYTEDGRSLVRKIMVSDENNKQLLTFPYRVFIAKSQIVVLNLRENVVSVDQQNGKVLWMYDGGQAKLDKKFCPAAICLDKFSNFLVPDDNNNYLHFIDSEGTLIKAIMTIDMGIKEPWGIGMDDQNEKIWCGSLYSNEVWILNYKK